VGGRRLPRVYKNSFGDGPARQATLKAARSFIYTPSGPARLPGADKGDIKGSINLLTESRRKATTWPVRVPFR